MKMTISPYLLWLSLLIAKLTGVMTQYSYPMKKSASPFSYTVYKNNKVTDGANPTKVEKHTSYQNCVTVCNNNIGWCKSIGVEIQNNITLNCQFFSYFPTTYIFDGFLFKKPKIKNVDLRGCFLVMGSLKTLSLKFQPKVLTLNLVPSLPKIIFFWFFKRF